MVDLLTEKKEIVLDREDRTPRKKNIMLRFLTAIKCGITSNCCTKKKINIVIEDADKIQTYPPLKKFASKKSQITDWHTFTD